MIDHNTNSNQTQYKKCTKCKETKPLSEFGKNSNSKDNHRPDCRICHNTVARQKYEKDKNKLKSRAYLWREANPEKHTKSRRNCHLKQRYGISLDEYNTLLKNQNGVCAICHKPSGWRSLHVDHDHATGKVRGLLCFQCNRNLGIVESFSEKALDYLSKFKGLDKSVSFY